MMRSYGAFLSQSTRIRSIANSAVMLAIWPIGIWPTQAHADNWVKLACVSDEGTNHFVFDLTKMKVWDSFENAHVHLDGQSYSWSGSTANYVLDRSTLTLTVLTFDEKTYVLQCRKDQPPQM